MAGEDDQDHQAHPAKVVDDPFRVFVVDLLGEDKRHKAWFVIPPEKLEDMDKDLDTVGFVTRTLTAWMSDVVNVNHPGAKAQVVFTTSVPGDIKRNELMVQLTGVPSSKFGATAARLAHGAAGEKAPPPAQGLTGLIDERGKKGKRLLCEVWPGTLKGGTDASPFAKGDMPGIKKFNKILCQLIFHEWMHCKIDVDTKPTVHDRTQSLGAVPINDDSPDKPPQSDTDDLGHDLAKEFTHFGAA